MTEQLGHTVYKARERETTIWDDAQRRLGNLPPLPEVWKPEAFSPSEEPSAQERVRRAGTVGEAEALEARVLCVLPTHGFIYNNKIYYENIMNS